MTITQTIEIPADHRLTIDLPRDLPSGTTAQVEVKVIPFFKKNEKPEQTKLKITRKNLDEMVKNSKVLNELTGILSELRDVDLDEIRYNALAEKHLK
jgi:hypothetical protein